MAAVQANGEPSGTKTSPLFWPRLPSPTLLLTVPHHFYRVAHSWLYYAAAGEGALGVTRLPSSSPNTCLPSSSSAEEAAAEGEDGGAASAAAAAVVE